MYDKSNRHDMFALAESLNYEKKIINRLVKADQESKTMSKKENETQNSLRAGE